MRGSRSRCVNGRTSSPWAGSAPRGRAGSFAMIRRFDISISAADTNCDRGARQRRRRVPSVAGGVRGGRSPLRSTNVGGHVGAPDWGGSMRTMTRRDLLKASGTAGLVLSAPALLSAQSKEPIPIGTLSPLTGAGGSYGPDMQRSVVAVVERINKAGGINGRPIQLFHEDDQTNAEAGVRAARKLIDVNKVGAIVSTWASAVTLAGKPLRGAARGFVIRASGAGRVAPGGDKGYLARTAPHTNHHRRTYDQ